jgi:hypothetical protein
MGKRINTRPRKCRWCKSPIRLDPSPVCWRCVAIDRAWTAERTPSDGERSKPFMLGFWVGSQDPRAGDRINPFAPGSAHLRWQRGHDAGAAHLNGR